MVTLSINRTYSLAGVFLLAALCGCGSSGSGNSLQDVVTSLQSTITTYNRDAQGPGIANTGRACRDASASLSAKQQEVTSASASGSQRAIVQALTRAYTSAIRGLGDCGKASMTLSYPLMNQATQEIALANHWIDRARRADH